MDELCVHGVRVPIAAEEVSTAIWDALKSELYEANEARRVRRAIWPGDRVLELGTGLGIITSIIAEIDDVRVWSFEADPRTARLAERVVNFNCSDNVVLAHGILAAGPPAKFRSINDRNSGCRLGSRPKDHTKRQSRSPQAMSMRSFRSIASMPW